MANPSTLIQKQTSQDTTDYYLKRQYDSANITHVRYKFN